MLLLFCFGRVCLLGRHTFEISSTLQHPRVSYPPPPNLLFCVCVGRKHEKKNKKTPYILKQQNKLNIVLCLDLNGKFSVT